jgi:hypothetical protein
VLAIRSRARLRIVSGRTESTSSWWTCAQEDHGKTDADGKGAYHRQQEREPNDPEKPFVTSGIPSIAAMTARIGEEESRPSAISSRTSGGACDARRSARSARGERLCAEFRVRPKMHASYDWEPRHEMPVLRRGGHQVIDSR